MRKSRHDTVSSIPDELYLLPQGVGHQDQGINVTDTEISNMIQEADLNIQNDTHLLFEMFNIPGLKEATILTLKK